MKLIKQKNSPYWYVRFFRNGKDVWLSTKKKNRKGAELAAQKIIALQSEKVDVDKLVKDLLLALATLPEAEREEKRHRVARQLLQGSSSKLELDKAFQSWLTNPRKRGNPKEVTIEGYKTIYKLFISWVTSNYPNITYMHDITQQIADSYAIYLTASKLSSGTYNSHIKFLQGFFRTLSLSAGVDINPFEGIERKPLDRESRRYLTETEIDLIFSKATGSLKGMLLVGYYTGLRLADVIQLRWSEIDFENNQINVIPQKVSRKKKILPISIHEELKSYLQSLPVMDTEYVFPDEVDIYKRDRTAVSRNIQKFFRDDCGLETNEPGNGNRRRSIVRVGFHSLRHTFVTELYKKGEDQRTIQELVGHGSPVMTDIYAHVGHKQKLRAVSKIRVPRLRRVK